VYVQAQWRQIKAAAEDAAKANCADREFQAGSAFLVRQSLARIEETLAVQKPGGRP
jgi:hypothetical protein